MRCSVHCKATQCTCCDEIQAPTQFVPVASVFGPLVPSIQYTERLSIWARPIQNGPLQKVNIDSNIIMQYKTTQHGVGINVANNRNEYIEIEVGLLYWSKARCHVCALTTHGNTRCKSEKRSILHSCWQRLLPYSDTSHLVINARISLSFGLIASRISLRRHAWFASGHASGWSCKVRIPSAIKKMWRAEKIVPWLNIWTTVSNKGLSLTWLIKYDKLVIIYGLCADIIIIFNDILQVCILQIVICYMIYVYIYINRWTRNGSADRLSRRTHFTPL